MTADPILDHGDASWREDTACLETALHIEVPADIGIWGGTTPATRRRLRRERARDRIPRRADKQPPQPRSAEKLMDTTGSLRLVADDNGDFIDRSGRVIVFEIHGDPPFMLTIDGPPRARTTTVDDAADLATPLLATTARSADAREGRRTPDDCPRRRT